MKRAIIALFLALPLVLSAQKERLDKYPIIPDALNLSFCDYCCPFASGVSPSTSNGQYFGQISPNKSPYGYGQFLMNDGMTITGQFRDGSFIFGIMMGSHIVKVGSPEHNVSYDLMTGEALNVTKDSVTTVVTPEQAKAYRFLQIDYKSGDRYVGETLNGKRNGYGIYHYKNGDFYYGYYRDNERFGCGAIFRTDRRVVIQHF